MPRPMPSRPDLTTQAGNPSSWIHDNYKRLMQTQDRDQLVQEVLAGLKPMAGSGMSRQNWTKFQLTINKQPTLEKVQQFITNFMLRGANLGVIGVGESCQRLSIANMINEDINDVIVLTPHQKRLKALVESYGFAVGVIHS